MTLKVLLITIVALQSVLSAPLPDATYETKYDNIDLDELLNSERLLKNYIKCLESKGPCTPDGKVLRDTLPDAISTDCSKCSERQKYGSDKVTHFLIDNRPEDWERLGKIYDPDGEYQKRYLESKNNQTAEPKQEIQQKEMLEQKQAQNQEEKKTENES